MIPERFHNVQPNLLFLAKNFLLGLLLGLLLLGRRFDGNDKDVFVTENSQTYPSSEILFFRNETCQSFGWFEDFLNDVLHSVEAVGRSYHFLHQTAPCKRIVHLVFSFCVRGVKEKG